MRIIKSIIIKETVMTIAFLLAVVSSCVVKPTAGQVGAFVDWRVLGILLSLMISVAGMREIGMFDKIAVTLLKHTHTVRALITVLVIMCFIFSMAFTNDVALIAFVPFTLFLLENIDHRELIIKTVILQTLAANLGSMLTPIGNPQNLYIYNTYKMGVLELIGTMAPYSALSLGIIFFVLLFFPKDSICFEGAKTEENCRLINNKKLAVFCFVFMVSLLAVGKIISWKTALVIALVTCLVTDKKVIGKVDYGLILTFVFFFVFIGNIGSIEWIREHIWSIISGNEVVASVCASQFLSNVPAALLLSEFTANGEALLIGVNLGGLGTLIASMASLISYKALAHSYNKIKGKYILWFTAANVIFLIPLMALYFITKYI